MPEVFYCRGATVTFDTPQPEGVRIPDSMRQLTN